MSIALAFPYGTYTSSNKPVVATLKADLVLLEGVANAAATLDGVEVLTNKTLTTPTLTKPRINASVQGYEQYTPGVGGTATLDLSLANRNTITMPAGNITIALSNGTTSQVFTIEITQDATGSRTVTWFTTIRWAGGVAPTLTTTASKRDIFMFIKTGSTTYDGFIVGQNI